MCLEKLEQWICLRHLLLPRDTMVDLENNGFRNAECDWVRHFALARDSCNMWIPYNPSCPRHRAKVFRRWFGLCSTCIEVAAHILQGGLQDRFRRAAQFDPHANGAPPEGFWVQHSRDDRGGLELKFSGERWELYVVVTGQIYRGECLEDWEEAERSIPLPGRE